MRSSYALVLIVWLALGAAQAATENSARPADAPASPAGKLYAHVPDRTVLASQFKFAVLDPVMTKPTPDEKALIDRATFVVRQQTTGTIPGLGVMTKENIIDLLGPELAAGCDDQCAATTGKQVGAEYIVDGRLRRAGATLELEMRLWQVRNGTQLSSIMAMGANDTALISDLRANIPALLAPVQLMLDAEIRAAQEQQKTREEQGKWDTAQEDKQREINAAAQSAANAAAAVKKKQDEEAALSRHAALRKAGWVVLGLGAASLIASGVSMMAGESITNKLQTGGYEDVNALTKDSSSVHLINSIAWGAGIGAGVLVLGGAGLLIFNQDPTVATAQLEVGPTGLMLAGSF